MSSTRGVVTSTFLNRNTFATYVGIGLSSPSVGLILQLIETDVATIGAPLRTRVLSFIENKLPSAVVLLGCSFVLLVALLLTGSRGGAISTAFGLLVLAGFHFRQRTGGSTRQRVAIMLGAVLVIAGLVGFGDILAERIVRQGLYDQDRFAVYRIVVEIRPRCAIAGLRVRNICRCLSTVAGSVHLTDVQVGVCSQ